MPPAIATADTATDTTAAATATFCARCGTRFECGVATGACWCATLPPLGRVDQTATTCLCRGCLQGELARQRQ